MGRKDLISINFSISLMICRFNDTLSGCLNCKLVSPYATSFKTEH